MFDDIRMQYDIDDEEPINFAFDPDNPNKKRSCAARLAQLRRQFGITDDDIETLTKPTEVKLPVFHEKMTKEIKEHIAKDKKAAKLRKYEVANWYLSEYSNPEERSNIFDRYGNLEFKEFLDAVYHEALDMIDLINNMNRPKVSKKDVIELILSETMIPVEPNEFDIPESQEEAFDRYCKKHPITDCSEIIPRRMKFKKWVNKTHKK